jgi:hypothetical protein
MLLVTWAEDRAMLGSNPSSDPGAGMGRGGLVFLALPFSDENPNGPSWPKSDKSLGCRGKAPDPVIARPPTRTRKPQFG